MVVSCKNISLETHTHTERERETEVEGDNMSFDRLLQNNKTFVLENNLNSTEELSDANFKTAIQQCYLVIYGNSTFFRRHVFFYQILARHDKRGRLS